MIATLYRHMVGLDWTHERALVMVDNASISHLQFANGSVPVARAWSSIDHVRNLLSTVTGRG